MDWNLQDLWILSLFFVIIPQVNIDDTVCLSVVVVIPEACYFPHLISVFMSGLSLRSRCARSVTGPGEVWTGFILRPPLILPPPPTQHTPLRRGWPEKHGVTNIGLKTQVTSSIKSLLSCEYELVCHHQLNWLVALVNQKSSEKGPFIMISNTEQMFLVSTFNIYNLILSFDEERESMFCSLSRYGVDFNLLGGSLILSSADILTNKIPQLIAGLQSKLQSFWIKFQYNSEEQSIVHKRCRLEIKFYFIVD